MDKCTVQVSNASFSYGSKKVFNNISFKIRKGEVFCVLGPNGCGKTTLLDCVLGILKLNEGNVLIGDTNLRELRENKLAEKMAYVPQTHERSFPYKVKEIVLMGRAHKTSIFTSPSEEDKKIAMDALEKVGISELADVPYTQISGGQCQLVMIARALAQQPEIIVMDEPTSHLDFKNELVVLETVADLVKKHNISILMATHFPNHAYYFETNHAPTTVVLMNNGIFEETGKPYDVLNEQNIVTTYNINSKVLDFRLDEMTSIRQVVPISLIKENQGGIK
ncbi:ABC transporter ATP-binding protein [Sedimentibacter sp. B4]|uniref:ABC transporter ATP-binding protein n=1 Tax=Sedimentibacter sp. B4 TaxID=304766 RepID=UPI0002D3A033|nr:ABC transporter ATP-binding protein [Sedimentibacter sp. B4]